jgi:hypothetical protein
VTTAPADALPITPLLTEHQATDPFPDSQLTSAFSGDVVVDCDGTQFPLDRVLKPRTGDELSAAVKKAYAGTANPDKTWIVAVADQSHVLIMQPQTNLDYTEYEIWDAYYNRGRWNVDDDQYPGNECMLRRALPALNLADWSVKTAPKPGDTTIQIEVDEFAGCTDGKSAADRVQVPILEVTKDGIRVAFGFKPLKQAVGAVCKSSARTLYTLKLPEAIGDRPVIDVGVYPEAKREAR